MKKLILVIIMNTLVTVSTFAIPAVISEIYYDSGPDNEWTEIMVVEDNISLVGYTIRDNSEHNGWQGGIKFKNTSLWNNLRSGTIIIINHRGGVVDDNKEDGYIEIGAESDYYFDKFFPTGGGGDWATGGSLDLNENYDMVQLRNPSGVNVHCLGYINGPVGANYDTIPKPNIFLNSGMTTGNSVKVVPGLTLNSYLDGLSSENIIGNETLTKGFPNRASTNDNRNQVLWRELRQPVWTNPGVINAKIVNDFSWIELSWNSVTSVSDPNEGYMILRYIENDNMDPLIEDGKIYQDGQVLGPFRIIGHLPDLSKSGFIDRFDFDSEFECGKKYSYRVYAYKFRQSDINPVINDYSDSKNARGRQYNEVTFASVHKSVVKEIPPVPIISTNITSTRFCSNSEVEIESNIQDNENYEYNWYSDQTGLIDDNDISIKPTESGDYRLEITSKSSGCTSVSNTLNITILETPETYIIEPKTNKTFVNDTLIILCEAQSIDVRGISLPSDDDIVSKWYKDGLEFATTNDINISMEGVYMFISVAGELCPDTAAILTVKSIAPDFELSAQLLEFDADTNPESDLILKNNSDEELVINSKDIIITPDNFKLLTPSIFPIRIAPNDSVSLTIRFEISGYGEKSGRIMIGTVCNYSKYTDLFGERIDIGISRLDPDVSELDLGLRATDCPDYDYGANSLTFQSSGPENIIVINPEFSGSVFRFSSDSFIGNPTIDLKPTGSFTGYIHVISDQPGEHEETLTVKYYIKGKPDTNEIHVKVKVFLYIPELSLFTESIDLSDLASCKKSLDSFVVVGNFTPAPITISKDIDLVNVNITDDLPLTIAPGEIDTIHLSIKFTDKTPFDVHINFENPCELISDAIEISAPSVDLDVVLLQDTIHFGTINNCENPGELIEELVINTSNEGAYIGHILYESDKLLSNIYKEKTLIKGDNIIRITIPSGTVGELNDSLSFVVEPCGEIYTIYVKGQRINPLPPEFSALVLDFGTDQLNTPGTRILTVTNENFEFVYNLDSIIVPSAYELSSHDNDDFPLSLAPTGYVDFTFTYKRSSSGIHDDTLTFVGSYPCSFTDKIFIRGATIDSRQYNMSVILPEYDLIELGSEKDIPLSVILDKDYSLSEFSPKSIVFYISYDYMNLDINSALLNQQVVADGNKLIFEEISVGKIKLTLELTQANLLIDGNLLSLKVKALLGNSTHAIIALDSVSVQSSIPAAIEISNQTEIEITGECDIEGRLLEINGELAVSAFKLPSSSSIQIEYSTISDEKTILEIYTYTGELLETLINKPVSVGRHSHLFDSANLSEGMYLIVLKNGVRTKTYNLLFIK